MLSVVAFSKLRLTLIAVAVLLAGSLAGCVGEDPPEPGAGTDVPAGCEGAVMAKIDAERNIMPAELTLSHPFTICLTNEHADPFIVKGLPNKLPKPGYVPLPTVIDPHADHRGGAAEPALPELSIAPGDTAVFSDVTYHGLVMVHDAADLDNNVVWEFIPAEEVSYPVVENSVILTGSGSGDTDAGSKGTHTFDVTVPDLERIKAKVTWDDSADDGEVGSTANRADKVVVRLLDPAGGVAVERELEKRTGELTLEHSIGLSPFPESVKSRGIFNASAALETERPPDESAVGTWTVEVEVLAAPGLAPDEDGSTKGLPTGDGHTAWALDLTVVHRWAWPTVAGGSKSPDIVEAEL